MREVGGAASEEDKGGLLEGVAGDVEGGASNTRRGVIMMVYK